MRDLADVYLLTGRHEKALKQEEVLIAEFERAGMLETAQALVTLQSHASGLVAFGRRSEAWDLLKRMLPIQDRLFGEGSRNRSQRGLSLQDWSPKTTSMWPALFWDTLQSYFKMPRAPLVRQCWRTCQS